MQMIHDAIKPEFLELAKRLFENEHENTLEAVEKRSKDASARLSDQISAENDRRAELADRLKFELQQKIAEACK